MKASLVNHRFIAGLGNAYSDEILWVAGIHPYRKRTAMSDDELAALYRSIPIVAKKMRGELPYEERREHLRMHQLGGSPAPGATPPSPRSPRSTGSPASSVTASLDRPPGPA